MRKFAAALLAFGMIAATACRDAPKEPRETPQDQRKEKTAMPATIEQAVAEASAWADIPGVESVGQGEQDGKPVIRVIISTPDARKRIPKTFREFAVIVEQGSPISAQGGRR